MHSASEDLVALPACLRRVAAAAVRHPDRGGAVRHRWRPGLPEAGAGGDRGGPGKGRDPLRLAAPPAVGVAARVRGGRCASTCTPSTRQLRRHACRRWAAAPGWPRTAPACWRTPPTTRASAGRTCRCAARSSWTPTAQRRLLRLLRWREAQARRSDRPRSWILDNELASRIWRAATPGDRAGIAGHLEATPRAPRSLAMRCSQALTTPLADEADAPLARGDDRDKKQLRAMQDAVAATVGGTRTARRSAGFAPMAGGAAGRRRLDRPAGRLATRHPRAASGDADGGWRHAGRIRIIGGAANMGR